MILKSTTGIYAAAAIVYSSCCIHLSVFIFIKNVGMIKKDYLQKCSILRDAE